MKTSNQMIGKLDPRVHASIVRERESVVYAARPAERLALVDKRVPMQVRREREIRKRAYLNPEQLEVRLELTGVGLPTRPLNEPVVPDAKRPPRKSGGRRIARRFSY